jgi:hypothetical protein
MYWVYDLSNLSFGSLTIAVFLLVGLGGYFATRKWVRSLHHEDHSYNDIVGFYLAALTVFYGITLGLLMVGVWANFSDTDGKVSREASTLAALYRDVSVYPEPTRSELQGDLRNYCRNVIDAEWPQQRKGILPGENLQILDKAQRRLASFEPETEGQKILHAEAFKQFNQLAEERRMRLGSVTTGLSSALWLMVLFGAFINIAATWFFHLRNPTMHFWMTVLLSVLLGLMIFLLAAMDHPYLGVVSVGPEAFEVVYDQLMKPGR